VLATVVRCEPPTSARPGDKAVITADGRLRGWIGGSCSEPIVRREALRALSEGVPQLVRIVPAPEVKQTRKRGELMVATTCPSGGALDIFIEPQLSKPLLLVFGDSPAARTLVQMGSLAGFRTCSVHPGARPEDFAAADMVLGSLELAGANPGPDTWAVVATMGHYDEDALEAALAHPTVEVGLVASTRRSAAVREALRGRGLDEATLARIRTPAGRVRGVSQEEIALVFDRNKGAIYALYGRALRDTPDLQGKLVLEFTIAPSGEVTDCHIVSSELKNAELESKIVARVKLFRFEAKDVAAITTTKPIEFVPTT